MPSVGGQVSNRFRSAHAPFSRAVDFDLSFIERRRAGNGPLTKDEAVGAAQFQRRQPMFQQVGGWTAVIGGHRSPDAVAEASIVRPGEGDAPAGRAERPAGRSSGVRCRRPRRGSARLTHATRAPTPWTNCAPATMRGWTRRTKCTWTMRAAASTASCSSARTWPCWAIRSTAIRTRSTRLPGHRPQWSRRCAPRCFDTSMRRRRSTRRSSPPMPAARSSSWASPTLSRPAIATC